MAISAGKIAEVYFDQVMETIEDQMMLLNLVERIEPGGAGMQNSGNIMWRPIEQQAVIQKGWDMTGKSTDIIEETYPSVLGLPSNDMVEQRVDDMRDLEFWRRRAKRSARQMAVEQNTTIAQAIATQGSLFYQSAATDGFDFISPAQQILNEQQRTHTERHFILNDASNRVFASQLAGRQTLQGRPEEAWAKGQIGANVAEFDLHVGSFLPVNTGGDVTATTVTATQSFKPEGGSVNQVSGAVTNVDYRTATIPVADSSDYEVGDKVTFENDGTPVMAVGASDKNNTLSPRTFAIVAVESGTSITVYPKPIAKDDPGLTLIEAASANVDTQITSGATVEAMNTQDVAKTNIFFDKDAVEVISGNIPADLFAEYNGHKVISATMKNGHPLYMVYDANIVNMNFRYRLFSWWDVTIKDPSRCGIALLN